jgi:hypothetical protein
VREYIKEGKNPIKLTRLSCRTFAATAVRLQLHVLAYNLGNFMRTLAMPKGSEPLSLTSLREKLCAKVVSHGRALRHLPVGRDRGPADNLPVADAGRNLPLPNPFQKARSWPRSHRHHFDHQIADHADPFFETRRSHCFANTYPMIRSLCTV